MIDRVREPEIIFHRLARAEYLSARRWYAKRSGEGLADRFRDAVNKSVQRIIESPETLAGISPQVPLVSPAPVSLPALLLPARRIEAARVGRGSLRATAGILAATRQETRRISAGVRYRPLET
jgi:hypothetical protein